MRNATKGVLHLAHPNPVSWTTLFSSASDDLKLPLVSYSEWLSKLSKSTDGLETEATVSLTERSPALRILDFFVASGNYNDDKKGREAMGLRRLELINAVASSPNLQKENVLALGAENVKAWISYWRSCGFFTA